MKYRVPFVDMPTQFARLESRLMPLLHDVLSRGELVLREHVREFERRIAEFVGTKFAVGVNSGFDALHLSVRAAGLGPDDEVITVAHTFVATIAAIVHAGATPVLVDVGADFNMDLDALEKAITPKTRALIPVHLNGRLCDMDRLMKIARKHRLTVIEDSAQALGATFEGRKGGAFGLTGCFSLYPFKLLGAYGDGGAVTTNDPEIAKKVTWYRDHGRDRSVEEYRFYGFNCRLDNVQAAILNVKMDDLSAWIGRRRAVAERYRKGLSDVPEVRLPHWPDPRYADVFQNYVLRAQRRDDLVRHLEKNGVETMVSWHKPTHHHEALGLKRFRLPETERLCHEVVSLPMNPELSDEQVEFAIGQVKAFYRAG